MMIYPFDGAIVPYTEVDMNNFTPKDRMVYCENCKLSFVINLYGAKCGKCHSNLINYPKSALDELASRNSESTR